MPLAILIAVIVLLFLFFPRVDIWLCFHLKPLRLRLWWRGLWVRADEFHPSTDTDVEALMTLSHEERPRYLKNLTRSSYELAVVRYRNRIHFHTNAP